MIETTSFRNLKPDNYDYVFAIVRFMKPMPGIRQLQVLSPDWDLFHTYRKLVAQDNWNTDTFETIYKPRFITQIKQDHDAMRWLDRLCNGDAKGCRIALACFCQDKTLCHRSIVANMLKSLNAQIIYN